MPAGEKVWADPKPSSLPAPPTLLGPDASFGDAREVKGVSLDLRPLQGKRWLEPVEVFWFFLIIFWVLAKLVFAPGQVLPSHCVGVNPDYLRGPWDLLWMYVKVAYSKNLAHKKLIWKIAEPVITEWLCVC